MPQRLRSMGGMGVLILSLTSACSDEPTVEELEAAEKLAQHTVDQIGAAAEALSKLSV